MSIRLVLSFVSLLPACQSSGADTAADKAPPSRGPTAIEVHDATGAVTARIVPGYPCRATIDHVELQIGTQPLVAQIGSVRWSGKVDVNGTTFHKDDAPVARMFGASPTELGLFDLEGVALIRASVTGTTATITDRQGMAVRTITAAASAPKGELAITGGPAPLTVTGTTDLLLAAVLTAGETSPEVRGLAACHRLFPIEARPESFGPRMEDKAI